MKLLYEFLIFIAFFILYITGAFMVLLPIMGVCIVLKVISHMPSVKSFCEESDK